jgi:hypothetical protein
LRELTDAWRTQEYPGESKAFLRLVRRSNEVSS